MGLYLPAHSWHYRQCAGCGASLLSETSCRFHESMPAMPDIFISYRRADSAAMCDRMNDYLLTRFSEPAVFRDVEHIPMGEDFRKRIKNVIAQCAVLLVIIGPRWLEITDEMGRRRLSLYDDPVRTEIELALKLGVIVFPVLVEGAHMPLSSALPPSIRRLLDRNGGQIRYDPDFKSDMKEVTDALDLLVQSIQVEQRPAARIARGELRETPDEPWTDIVELRSRKESEGVPPEQRELTVYYPLDVPPGTSECLLTYVHSWQMLDTVRLDAERKFATSDNIRTRCIPQDVSSLTAGKTMSLRFSGNDVAFTPARMESMLVDGITCVEARFTIPQRPSGQTASGEIAVTLEGQLIATIRVPLLIAGASEPQEAESSTYQVVYQRVFISYSHKDAAIAQAVNAALRALGIRTFLDVDSLRSGAVFDNSLKNLIQSADVFQLMWSHNAASSEYVRREWQYALSLRRREGFIRPVYWETPMPPPPPELAQYHFAFMPALASPNTNSLP